MAQFPGPSADWIPLAGSQFLSPTTSTALTIPSAAPLKGMDYVAILVVQGDSIYMRTDGGAVVANAQSGVVMTPGDFRFIYGLPSLKAIRVIRASANSVLAAEYYAFRVQPI